MIVENLILIGFLAFLESALSLDNALVLALMVQPLPRKQQRQALTYGLVGAVVLRLAALALMVSLIHLRWVKFVGGAYLLFVAGRGLFGSEKPAQANTAAPVNARAFWILVLQIELLDLAFAVDSILAAVALTDKLWIVFVGGLIGVIMMRFAASAFAGLLRNFPSLVRTTWWLVALIGGKVILDGARLPGLSFDSPSEPPFWVFWSLLALCVALGFRRRRGPSG